MSSGSLLLRQLQERRERQLLVAAVEEEKNNHIAGANAYITGKNKEISNKNRNEVVSSSSIVKRRHHEEQLLTSSSLQKPSIETAPRSTRTEIEVCLGPDCLGCGSGATILEIEDLISRYGYNNEKEEEQQEEGKMIFNITIGGCQDKCTMGPNVHIRKLGSGASTADTSTPAAPYNERGAASFYNNDNNTQQFYFSKVNCPESCREIIDSLGAIQHNFPTSTSRNNTTSKSKILQLREDGRRWKLFRKNAANERRLQVRERKKNTSNDTVSC